MHHEKIKTTFQPIAQVLNGSIGRSSTRGFENTNISSKNIIWDSNYGHFKIEDQNGRFWPNTAKIFNFQMSGIITSEILNFCGETISVFESLVSSCCIEWRRFHHSM